MKIAPIIIIGGVVVAVVVAWQMGWFPQGAKDALDQGRAAVENQINSDGNAPPAEPVPDCDVTDLSACQVLGEAYRDGNGVEMDKTRALQIFQTACDANSINGCMALSYMYQTGDGVSQDRARAFSLMRSPCDQQGDTGACALAGQIAIMSDPPDYANGLTYVLLACEGGDAISCHNAGSAYSDPNFSGADEGKAREFLNKACDMGLADACEVVGR